MDTAFEAKIVRSLEIISQTANEAWWDQHGDHCGSDFNIITCQRCFAFDQCKRNEALIALFIELNQAVG